MTLKDVIDRQQAADILDLTPGRVSQLLRAGELPGHRLGKSWILHGPTIRRIARRRQKYGRPAVC